jgi:hypothetical protein
MLTFKVFLKELFNKPVEFEHHSERPGLHMYHTSHAKILISHHMEKNKPIAHIDFADHEGNMHKTGNKNAFHAFNEVHHVIKHHLQNNSHIQGVKFEADDSEPSRQHLYSKLSHHFAHKHKETEDANGIKTYRIKTKDMK